jgi:hypothetical protein
MAVFVFLLQIAVAVVTLVAWVKIITKAGYSGWWIMVPVSSALFALAAVITGVNSTLNILRTRPVAGSPFQVNTSGFALAGTFGIIAFLLGVASWILFVVFAFSDWPALGRARRNYPVADRLSMPAGPVTGGGEMAPPKSQERGWYQSGATNNDQAYWDGQAWTGRRRWDGAGWVDVPL